MNQIQKTSSFSALQSMLVNLLESQPKGPRATGKTVKELVKLLIENQSIERTGSDDESELLGKVSEALLIFKTEASKSDLICRITNENGKLVSVEPNTARESGKDIYWKIKKNPTRNKDLAVRNWQLQLMEILPSVAGKKGLTVAELANQIAGPENTSHDRIDKDLLIHKIQKTLTELYDSKWGDNLIREVETTGQMKVLEYSKAKASKRTLHWRSMKGAQNKWRDELLNRLPVGDEPGMSAKELIKNETLSPESNESSDDAKKRLCNRVHKTLVGAATNLTSGWSEFLICEREESGSSSRRKIEVASGEVCSDDLYWKLKKRPMRVLGPLERKLMEILPKGDKSKGVTVEKLAELLGRTEDPQEVDQIENALKSLVTDREWGKRVECLVQVDGPDKMTNVDDLLETQDDSKKSPGNHIRKRTYWRWKEGHGLILPPPNEHASLSLLMLEKRLASELPPATLSFLKPFFAAARKRVEDSLNSGFKNWERKIVNQSPNQFLAPKHPKEEVQSAVMTALFENRPLRITYMKPMSDAYQDYRILPLGLIMRGPVSYLYASKIDDGERRMFVLPRMSKAEAIDEVVTPVPAEVFDDFVKQRGADFIIGGLADGEIIKLEARVSKQVQMRLDETPLADNQDITEISDRGLWHLSVELPITMQLGWWIMGFGPRFEVIGPKDLREWIASQHRLAAKNYGDL